MPMLFDGAFCIIITLLS